MLYGYVDLEYGGRSVPYQYRTNVWQRRIRVPCLMDFCFGDVTVSRYIIHSVSSNVQHDLRGNIYKLLLLCNTTTYGFHSLLPCI